MTGPNPDILIDTADLRATFVDVGAAARPLVVTFDSLTHDTRLDRPGFGQGWLDAQGYDAVHVVSRLNAWYQQPEMADLAPRVRALSAARARTVTYGSSMGGYAAVRFAGRVGAQAAIAISPQFSIDPRRAPFDRRWAEHARGLQFLWEEPEPEDAALQTAWVVYDPHDLDRRHMEALSAVYPVAPVALPYAGHPAGGFLVESGLLGGMVLGMVEGDFDPVGFAREVRARRRNSAHYLSVISRRQPRSRVRTAAWLAAQAADMESDQPLFLMENAYWIEAADRLDEAEALYRRAVSLLPEHPRFRLALASFLVRTGRGAAEAVELVRDIDRFGVERGVSLGKAAEVMFLAGRLHEALAEADKARAAAALSRADRRDAALLRLLLRLGAPGRLLLHAARRERLRRVERARLQRGKPLRNAGAARS